MNSRPDNRALLIAGPTASGKSALALAVARARGGVVINTDSMQVYRDLRMLTARPTPEEEAMVPHRLYGTVDAAVNFSAGAWVDAAREVLAEVRQQGRLPIFIGGSGLYFKALTRGLSAVPPVPDAVREGVRARLERLGPEALHAELAMRDPASAARLNLRDRTRIARALEVIEATGRALTDWHSDAPPPLLPAMKAHGVPALISHLHGEISREQACAIGQADTRHYAKRQFTWFRHQLPEFEWMTAEEARAKL